MSTAPTTLAELSANAGGWLRQGRRVVSATLVEVEGSAPLPAGATMLIDEAGTVEGSLTGGCVEGAVAQEAERVLAGGDRRLLRYGVSDELAGTVGLSCGGVVHIFLQPLAGEDAKAELRVLDATAAGRPAAVAMLLDGDRAGHRMTLVEGRLEGGFGGPSLLDANVGRELEGLLDEGRSTLRRFGADGATMGSDLRVHFRSFAPAPRMVIVGAIDFAAALAPLAAVLGYAVTIVEGRERFTSSPRFTRAAEVVVGWPQEVLPPLELGPRDAVLVFTHDAKFDEPALLAALAGEAGYIGALGSRRTAKDRNRRLREAGADEQQLARIHAPCGLDIGSRTAEETAVSVLAEIIASRSARSGAPLVATAGPIHSPEEGSG